jgi:hypothetical protein
VIDTGHVYVDKEKFYFKAAKTHLLAVKAMSEIGFLFLKLGNKFERIGLAKRQCGLIFIRMMVLQYCNSGADSQIRNINDVGKY